MELEIQIKKIGSFFDLNQLLILSFLLTADFFDAVWWAVLALPKKRG